MGKHTRIRSKSPRHRAERGSVPIAPSGMLVERPQPPQYRRQTTADAALVTDGVPWWLGPRDTGEVPA